MEKPTPPVGSRARPSAEGPMGGASSPARSQAPSKYFLCFSYRIPALEIREKVMSASISIEVHQTLLRNSRKRDEMITGLTETAHRWPSKTGASIPCGYLEGQVMPFICSCSWIGSHTFNVLPRRLGVPRENTPCVSKPSRDHVI